MTAVAADGRLLFDFLITFAHDKMGEPDILLQLIFLQDGESVVNARASNARDGLGRNDATYNKASSGRLNMPSYLCGEILLRLLMVADMAVVCDSDAMEKKIFLEMRTQEISRQMLY